MKERSAKLRADRPFKIRHRPWFGKSPLNGMVWEIQMRVKRPGKTNFVVVQIRDGGPFSEYRSLGEALSEARECRANLRSGAEP